MAVKILPGLKPKLTNFVLQMVHPEMIRKSSIKRTYVSETNSFESKNFRKLQVACKYKGGLIVVGLKNLFKLFPLIQTLSQDSSRSCLASMTFGAQALRLLYGCM